MSLKQDKNTRKLDTRNHSIYTKRRHRGMWKLQTNLHNENHIQNMVRDNNAGINQDRAHTRKEQSICLKRRNIHNRLHHQGGTIRRKCQPRCRNLTNGLIKSIWGDQQNAPMENTIQERNTNRHDKTHKTRTPIH